MHMFGSITNLCKKRTKRKATGLSVCLPAYTICNASFLDKGGERLKIHSGRQHQRRSVAA